MPSNKRAALRYRLIDQALQRRHKIWTFEAFLEHINEQLSEHCGVGVSVGKRTLESDFQTMRKDPPEGFSAPIIYQKGLVRYGDPDFSIEKMPLSHDDVKHLNEALVLLRQFPELDIDGPLDAIIGKVRQRMIPVVSTDTPHPVIYFEKNHLLKGLELLSDLYKATKERTPIRLRYRPFNMESLTFEFHPYLLKEYNNRWFVIGYQALQKTIWNLSLDRIEYIQKAAVSFIPNTFFDPQRFFEQIIGVTLPENGIVTQILLEADDSLAPYLMTKPLHPSQQVTESQNGTTMISLELIPNYEFYSAILSHIPRLKVVSPESIRNKMKSMIQEVISKYEK
jgi:predicted DNA-binding transcriptional regulator YafY